MAAFVAVALVLLVSACPEDVVETVKAGVALPLMAWQILLPLAGLGLAAGAVRDRVALLTVALFAIAMLAAGEPAEDYLLAHQDVLAFLVRFPVTDCVMATSAGLALILANGRLAGMLLPAAVVAGLAFGLTIGIESPGDTQTRWYADAAFLTALAVVLAALLVRRLATGSWWPIPQKIVGCWLIAAGILLAGLAVAPKPPVVPDADSFPRALSPPSPEAP